MGSYWPKIIATPFVGWSGTELARVSLFIDHLIWVKDDLGDES